jgi:hypothetical protein
MATIPKAKISAIDSLYTPALPNSHVSKPRKAAFPSRIFDFLNFAASSSWTLLVNRRKQHHNARLHPPPALTVLTPSISLSDFGKQKKK